MDPLVMIHRQGHLALAQVVPTPVQPGLEDESFHSSTTWMISQITCIYFYLFELYCQHLSPCS